MFEEILKQIEKYDTIVIFGHDYPDGDCLGSQIGLRESLRLTYPQKKIYATGSGIRRFEPIVGKVDDVSDDIISNCLAILLDGNDLSRMEDQRIVKAKAFAKLDHHVENGKFKEGPFVVIEEANSTCEIVLDFIRKCNLKYNSIVCNALYLGILTDSGRFQFIEDFPKAFKDAAWLCENGANPKSITRVLQATNEYSIAFKGYVFTHYKKTKGGVIYCHLTGDELGKFNLSINKSATMVNLIGNVIDYPIWAFFCEDNEHVCKVEFRSSDYTVQPIAVKYGGGGHKQAAGCTILDFNEKILNQILDELDSLIKKEK